MALATKDFLKLLDVLHEEDIRLLTIHPRTREQKYQGQADWQLIAKAQELFKDRLVGSGDILDLASFKARQKLASLTKHFMIGRGAIRNPWIFLSYVVKKFSLLI